MIPLFSSAAKVSVVSCVPITWRTHDHALPNRRLGVARAMRAAADVIRRAPPGRGAARTLMSLTVVSAGKTNCSATWTNWRKITTHQLTGGSA